MLWFSIVSTALAQSCEAVPLHATSETLELALRTQDYEQALLELDRTLATLDCSSGVLSTELDPMLQLGACVAAEAQNPTQSLQLLETWQRMVPDASVSPKLQDCIAQPLSRLQPAIMGALLTHSPVFVDGVLLAGGEHSLPTGEHLVQEITNDGLRSYWVVVTSVSVAVIGAPAPSTAHRSRNALVVASSLALLGGSAAYYSSAHRTLSGELGTANALLTTGTTLTGLALTGFWLAHHSSNTP